jgi:phosphoglycerate dehydrogenase-like enzyme
MAAFPCKRITPKIEVRFMTEVLVAAGFSDELMQKIRAVSPDLEVKQMKVDGGKLPQGEQFTAEIMYVTAGVPHPQQAPNLRWVQTYSAGVDRLHDEPLWESDVVITNSSGIHAPNIAQYVMAQMLAWAHRVPRWLRLQANGQWHERRSQLLMPEELRDKTLGIAGYGSIGREIARLARAFGMEVLATKRDARQLEDTNYNIPDTGDPEGVLPARIYPGEATRSMVAECDYVVITLPLTEMTHHLFDEEMFRAMRTHAFLVNIGRGPVVKESDLVRALKKGWIAGAGLDVFEKEPLPADSPLWELDNVILSPHISGHTPHYDTRAVDLFCENLQRYLSGKPLLNVVNREFGY